MVYLEVISHLQHSWQAFTSFVMLFSSISQWREWLTCYPTNQYINVMNASCYCYCCGKVGYITLNDIRFPLVQKLVAENCVGFHIPFRLNVASSQPFTHSTDPRTNFDRPQRNRRLLMSLIHCCIGWPINPKLTVSDLFDALKNRYPVVINAHINGCFEGRFSQQSTPFDNSWAMLMDVCYKTDQCTIWDMLNVIFQLQINVSSHCERTPPRRSARTALLLVRDSGQSWGGFPY